MLYYVSTRPNAQTLAPLLIYYRRDLLRCIRFVPIDSIELLTALECGTVIWTDLDRMTPGEFD